MAVTVQHVVRVIRMRLYNHSVDDYEISNFHNLVVKRMLEYFVSKNFNTSKEIRAWCNSPCSDMCAVCHDWMEDDREGEKN